MLDPTELSHSRPSPTPSCNRRFGLADYGEIFKFETPLTFLLSVTNPIYAHRSVATRVDLQEATGYALEPGDSRPHCISRENCFLRGRIGRTRVFWGLRFGLGHVLEEGVGDWRRSDAVMFCSPFANPHRIFRHSTRVSRLQRLNSRALKPIWHAFVKRWDELMGLSGLH